MDISRIVTCILFIAASVSASPVVRNVRVSQRADSRLVDIYYDLLNPLGFTAVELKISSDNGATYGVSTSSVTGEAGASVSEGADRHIVWNALADRPSMTASGVQFKLTAVESVISNAEMDPDTLEFVNRSELAGDAVSAAARSSLDVFVRESKRLGLWSKMVFVPCRDGFGAMNTLGGSPKRTNARFIRQGTTTLTTDGVKFNPGANYVNRVQTPFDWNPADEPVFVGVLGHTDTGANMYPYYSYLRWNSGTTSNLLGTYNCGPPGYAMMMGFSTPASGSGEFLVCNQQCTSIRRPNFAGAQFDGSHTLKGVLNQNYTELTHPTAGSGRPAYGPVYFFQPAPEDQTHVVQACMMIYGDVSALPMKALWSLMASTYLSDEYGKYTYFYQGGQSNSYFATLDGLAFGAWQSTSAPLFNWNMHRFGGQYISYWVGQNPEVPVRTENYDLAKLYWDSEKPGVKATAWDPVYMWVQGESDTEQDETSKAYKKNLTSLVQFLRQDLRPDLVMCIALIDYAIAYRTLEGSGNFSVVGCGGAASDAIGNFVITPVSGLENASADYTFLRGRLQLTRDGGASGHRWRMHDGSVDYYIAEQDESHPVLITSWTAMNGATGAPEIGVSRTGNIERVRKAERDFVAENPLCFLVDTRGLPRDMDSGGGDYVHMTGAGYIQLADRFAAAYDIWRAGDAAAWTSSSPEMALQFATNLEQAVLGAGVPAANAAAGAMPFGDGLSNLVKYAFGLDLSKADVHVMAGSGNSGLPVGQISLVGGSSHLQLKFLRRLDDSSVHYTPQFSTDMSNWIPASAPALVELVDSNWERVTVDCPASLSTLNKCFVRVELSYGEP